MDFFDSLSYLVYSWLGFVGTALLSNIIATYRTILPAFRTIREDASPSGDDIEGSVDTHARIDFVRNAMKDLHQSLSTGRTVIDNTLARVEEEIGTISDEHAQILNRLHTARAEASHYENLAEIKKSGVEALVRELERHRLRNLRASFAIGFLTSALASLIIWVATTVLPSYLEGRNPKNGVSVTAPLNNQD